MENTKFSPYYLSTLLTAHANVNQNLPSIQHGT